MVDVGEYVRLLLGKLDEGEDAPGRSSEAQLDPVR